MGLDANFNNPPIALNYNYEYENNLYSFQGKIKQ